MFQVTLNGYDFNIYIYSSLKNIFLSFIISISFKYSFFFQNVQLRYHSSHVSLIGLFPILAKGILLFCQGIKNSFRIAVFFKCLHFPSNKLIAGRKICNNIVKEYFMINSATIVRLYNFIFIIIIKCYYGFLNNFCKLNNYVPI